MSIVLIEKRIISTTTAAPITFTGPWSDYTDLEIYANIYCSGAGVQAIKMQLNGDTGSNYSNYWMESTIGTSLNSSGEAATTSTWITYTPGNNTSFPLCFRLRMFDINSTSLVKPFTSRFGGIAAHSGTYNNVWKSTSAVTSISFLRNGENNILAGSSISVYGVK